MGTIKTINVVEMADGEILGIHSFPKNKAGRNEAKIRMFDVIKENEPDLLDEEIEQAVKSKSFDQNGYSAAIIEGE